MTDLFQTVDALLPQTGLEIKQTQQQDRMKSKKAKTRKLFFFPLNAWDLRKQIICYCFLIQLLQNNLESIKLLIQIEALAICIA